MQHVASKIVLILGQGNVVLPVGGLLLLLTALIRLIVVHNAIEGISGGPIILVLASEVI